jgi:hypothetical protein
LDRWTLFAKRSPLRTAETRRRDTGGDASPELELVDPKIRIGGLRGAIAVIDASMERSRRTRGARASGTVAL